MPLSTTEIVTRDAIIDELGQELPDGWSALVLLITPRGRVTMGGCSINKEDVTFLLEGALEAVRKNPQAYGRGTH